MPSLADLVRAVPDDLLPQASSDPDLDRPVTAVHVSELPDPTPYLDGGELLLTTGLPLTRRLAQARSYVARLAAHGLSGLALGVGPVHEEVPQSLISSCADAGLPLLVIPAPTPFLTVTRAYFSLVQRADRAELTTALGAHRDLARAAMTRDPVSAVVRVLAGGIGGWAARLGPEGEPLEVWPRGQRMTTRRLAREVDRLRVAGPHGAATFPLDEEDVVVHPVSRGPHLTGFVAVGAPRPMGATARGLVLAACTLLSAVLDETLTLAATARARRAAALDLVLAGEVTSARLLAADLRQALPHTARLLVALPGPDRSAEQHLATLDTPGLRPRVWASATGARLVVLIPPDQQIAVARSLEQIAHSDVRLRMAFSPVAPLEAMRDLLGPTSSAAHATYPQPDLARAMAADLGSLSHRHLIAIKSYPRAPLLPTAVAYLRHRGHWERVAQATGTHRNTVRSRVATIRDTLGIDLDDPDVAAALWLAMRRDGTAGNETQ